MTDVHADSRMLMPDFAYFRNIAHTYNTHNIIAKVMSGSSSSSIVCTPIPFLGGQFGVILDNVFSEEECRQLIAATESVGGYEAALVNVGGGMQAQIPEVRNNDRYMRDDPELAKQIWTRIQPYCPQTWKGYPAVGLNERMRFLRYDPGQEFKEHCDGHYKRPNGKEMSFVTVQIYLNGGEHVIGGCTRFYARPNVLNNDFDVYPQAGCVVLFQHSRLPHSGTMTTQGRKYALRTDVMYQIDAASSSGWRWPW